MKKILIISIIIAAYLFGQFRTNPNYKKSISEESIKKISVFPTKSTVLEPTAYTPVFTPGEFHGYPCTEDCSGHEAGFEWAEEHDITDPDDCEGKSESFIEGCKAYAEEYQENFENNDNNDYDY